MTQGSSRQVHQSQFVGVVGVACGEGEVRNVGGPEGCGVASRNVSSGDGPPLLANLFMHHAFDDWLSRNYPHLQFERYADDAIIQCVSEAQAQHVLGAVRKRLKECGPGAAPSEDEDRVL